MVVALDDHHSFEPESVSGTLFEAASSADPSSEGVALVNLGTTPVSGWPASNPKTVRSRVGTFDLAGNFSGGREPTTIDLLPIPDNSAVTAPGLCGSGSRARNNARRHVLHRGVPPQHAFSNRHGGQRPIHERSAVPQTGTSCALVAIPCCFACSSRSCFSQAVSRPMCRQPPWYRFIRRRMTCQAGPSSGPSFPVSGSMRTRLGRPATRWC